MPPEAANDGEQVTHKMPRLATTTMKWRGPKFMEEYRCKVGRPPGTLAFSLGRILKKNHAPPYVAVVHVKFI